MQFGCCCKIEENAQARVAGFDFIECAVTALQPESDDETIQPLLDCYRESALPIPAFNVFLPGDLKVTGPDVDWARVQAYVASALDRVQSVGGRTIVFGSGRSRNIPPGFDRQTASGQLVRFLGLVADVAEPLDITVIIEPLNRKESNVINSVAEGVALARQVDRPAIRVLADFYHMDEEQESLSHLLAYADWLAHIHVADSGRRAPGTGSYPYAEFFANLHQIGYAGRISVECRWQDFVSEAPKAVQFLRTAWQNIA